MTYEQAAQYLNVTVRMVRKFVSAGLIPATRYGHRTVRFDRQHLDNFKRKCTK
tara:strand:+ start:120 stop:278 length:159 start_codon:yes stop_codon:yes gene_type:complete